MPATLHTLQIVSIQHELAMAIGLHSELQPMLQAFAETAIRRLSLRSIHVLLCHGRQEDDASTELNLAESVFSLPQALADDPGEREAIEAARVRLRDGAQTLVRARSQGLHLLAYRLPEIGMVVLLKQQAMPEPITQALVPVFTRLAVSCRACIEHQNLVLEMRARNAAELALMRQAAHDTLTDLPNRKTLMGSLAQSLAAARRQHEFGAVFFIDLNKFKQVNDLYGHGAGDFLLRKMAERLRRCARAEDIQARYGGDEFVVVSNRLGDDERTAAGVAQTIAENLLERLQAVVSYESRLLDVTVSIGIALFPNPDDAALSLEESCEMLLRYADTAMYRAKNREHSGFEFFSREMQASADRRLRIEAQLKQAIARDEFRLSFQPILGNDGEVVSAEALLRWHNADLGEVAPTDFIAVAEESSRILEVGNWVLQSVCRTIHDNPEWFERGLKHISINVSARELRQPDFVPRVLEALDYYRVPKGQLQIEVTETAAIDDIENTIRKMNALVLRGVHFSLDDFGTGYSSLSYLNRLPVSLLKIDRSFVRRIDRNPDHRAVVDAALAMAERLSVNVVVEGVETQDEAGYFADQCIYGLQGFYLGKPMQPVALGKLILARQVYA